ncbi:hypothetical protein D3C72_602850 [compost metagenome]
MKSYFFHSQHDIKKGQNQTPVSKLIGKSGINLAQSILKLMQLRKGPWKCSVPGNPGYQ